MSNIPGALPFYPGQKVILNPALPDKHRVLKHGITYIISECVSKINPANGMGPFIYIGIVGVNNGQSWLSPKLVVPIEWLEASIMSFEQILATNPIQILINN